tara:strand:+ start:8994 stop:9209 length:216 start_codon:yes stop_codon:yes gene_type:complete
MKKKLIIINEQDQNPINKIKGFLKKIFFISLSIVITVTLIYVAIVISVFIIGFLLFFGLVAYIYLKFKAKG